MKKKRILIVEDELIVAQDMQQTLVNIGYNVVGIANSYEQGLSLFMEMEPELIICDIKLKSAKSGVELAQKIKKINKVPIIFITAYSDENTLAEAFKIEPEAYLTKPFTDEQLIVTVSRIFKCCCNGKGNGHSNSHGNGNESIVIPTDREVEIIAHIAMGYSSKEIAEKLCISFETVQTHRKNIFKKYKVTSSAELITLAHFNNWLN